MTTSRFVNAQKRQNVELEEELFNTKELVNGTYLLDWISSSTHPFFYKKKQLQMLDIPTPLNFD